jgi:DNA-binding transcriptional ArsR family regulator
METAPDLVWRALADPTRRAILDLLAKGPHTTGDLVNAFDSLCRTAVMKHLDVLGAADLVLVRREGRTRWNYLNPVPIQQVCARWVNLHLQRLTSSMTRLKAIAEELESTRPAATPPTPPPKNKKHPPPSPPPPPPR